MEWANLGGFVFSEAMLEAEPARRGARRTSWAVEKSPWL